MNPTDRETVLRAIEDARGVLVRRAGASGEACAAELLAALASDYIVNALDERVLLQLRLVTICELERSLDESVAALEALKAMLT